MKLTEVTILNVPTEVHINAGGTFRVYLKGHAEDDDAQALSTGASLSEAVERAKPQVRQRKVKVNVPFYRMTHFQKDDGVSFQQGTATGFHAGTGNVLAVVNGENEQLGSSGYRSGTAYRGDMPQEARDELIRLRREIRERSDRQREIDGTWSFDLAEAVREAIEAS